ncbi:MAG TPA: fibronectin type III domain-containing protein [Nocardioidaceae bacterium]|nr:fibronectin type III domain-containing protein [Nocardioidaceae bacterium]
MPIRDKLGGHMRRGLNAAAAAFIATGLAITPFAGATAANKAPTNVVANYQMENDTGTTMADSAGTNDGAIGAGAAVAGLDTHAAIGAGFGYQWATPTVVNDARVVLVPDSADLDPGSGEFAVEAKIKTSATSGVIAQKGDSATAGGQWRVQLQGGQVSCLFRSDTVQGATKSKSLVNNNQWRTIRCELTATGTTVYVDDVKDGHQNKAVTGIDNADTTTVGGKVGCASVNSCQYYVGQVDYLTVFKGGALDNVAPVAKFTTDCTANDGTCSFDASTSTDSDGTIASYEWDWTNDGSFEGSGINPTHDFVTPGTYSVKLRVTDNDGATDSAVHSVTVLTGTPSSRPRQPAATAGDHAATVTWKRPSADGQGTITGYTATSFPDGKTCAAIGADTLTCDVTGLKAGTAYTFRVRAESTVGPSANSKETNAVTPFGKPGAPAKVTAKAGNKQAKVTWTPAKPNGKAVSSYIVTRLPGGVKKTVDGSARSTVFKKLKNGHPYHFTVAGVNAAGRGKATASKNVTPAGVPSKVTGVSAKGGNNSAVVKWSAAKPNGSAIAHYKIVSSDGQHRVVGGKALKVKMTFLKAGHSYKFRVRAVNKTGDGPWSAWTKPVRVH